MTPLFLLNDFTTRYISNFDIFKTILYNYTAFGHLLTSYIIFNKVNNIKRRRNRRNKRIKIAKRIKREPLPITQVVLKKSLLLSLGSS